MRGIQASARLRLSPRSGIPEEAVSPGHPPASPPRIDGGGEEYSEPVVPAPPVALRKGAPSPEAGLEAKGREEPGCALIPPSSERSAGPRGRGGRPGLEGSRLSPDSRQPEGSPCASARPANLRVSVGWGPSGLPLPRTQLGAPEPGGGAAGARGASASALGAGGPVPRARGRGAGAPGRRVGEGRGRDGRKEGGAGAGGCSAPALSAPRTLAPAARAQPGVAPCRARSSLPPPAPWLPRSRRGSSAERADGRTTDGPGKPRPAPPGRAMLIAPPGPARGISTARPAAPAASGDYEPESAALPGPPLSQPGHGLPPDRVRAARTSCTRVPAKLAWLGEGLRRPRAAAGRQLPWLLREAGWARCGSGGRTKTPLGREPQGRARLQRHGQGDRPS